MKNILLGTLFGAGLLSGTTQAQERLSPELLWDLDRVSGHSVSPNQDFIVFGKTSYDIKENSGNRDLYRYNVTTKAVTVFANNPKSEFNEEWRPDGLKVGFLRSTKSGPQLFEVNPDGSGERQLTNIEGGLIGFHYAPSGDRILMVRSVKLDNTTQDRYPDLPHADGRVIDDLMYRHWTQWDDYSYQHVFWAEYNNGNILSEPVDIMEGERFDSPMNPFGGMEEISWSPDGKLIAYTCKKLSGKEYAESTNSEIYLYNTETGETSNLTEGMEGYDKEPVFSPSGRYLAWSSMRRNGFESDKNRLFIYDLIKEEKRELTGLLDRNFNHLVWSEDEKTIYGLTGEKATYQICSIDIKSRKFELITEGNHNFVSLSILNKDEFIAGQQNISSPTDLYIVDEKSGDFENITYANAEQLDGVIMGSVEARMIPTTDGKMMKTWVIFPPNFDPTRKYPALLYCQGGPQSAVSQFFSYRWNFQLMAANDYIIIAPNRRGLPSFGRKWNDDISKDWGGQAMKDYLSAVDYMKQESYIDETRIGAVGASYGGYSVYWLAGNHDNRFKTFISHCGLFNLESWYGTTEELFFANWDIGGPYWEGKQMDYNKFSPHKFVRNWDTPILVIHSEKDFRVPIGEGLQAFQVAQLKDLKSRFLYFPSEGHWILQPQNGLLWHREFFRWLDETLK